MAYDFETLNAKQIRAYMEENATEKQRKEFVKIAYHTQKKRVGIEVKDDAGNTVMYQVMTKDGVPKLDKHGKPLMRKKLRYVEQSNGKEETIFSLLNAKWWFAKTFPDAVENVPTKKEPKEKAGDLFLDWM